MSTNYFLKLSTKGLKNVLSYNVKDPSSGDEEEQGGGKKDVESAIDRLLESRGPNPGRRRRYQNSATPSSSTGKSWLSSNLTRASILCCNEWVYKIKHEHHFSILRAIFPFSPIIKVVIQAN